MHVVREFIPVIAMTAVMNSHDSAVCRTALFRLSHWNDFVRFLEELLPRQRVCKNSEFQCATGNGTGSSPVCVPRSFQCDGYNDCPDRSDEVGCGKSTADLPARAG